MVLRLGCSLACGIFLDQGSSPCPSHWQVGSYPLHHLGSPRETVLSGHGSTATPLPQVPAHTQQRGSRKDTHLPGAPWKGPNNMFSQLLPANPASNQPKCNWAECHPPLWDSDRSWHTLSCWEPLRTKEEASTITEG